MGFLVELHKLLNEYYRGVKEVTTLPFESSFSFGAVRSALPEGVENYDILKQLMALFKNYKNKGKNRILDDQDFNAFLNLLKKIKGFKGDGYQQAVKSKPNYIDIELFLQLAVSSLSKGFDSSLFKVPKNAVFSTDEVNKISALGVK